MKFVADESVDLGIVKAIRAAGFEVWAIMENAPSIADPDVLTIAVAKKSVLLTEDKDFGDLVFLSGLPHHGVILLRLSGLPLAEKQKLVIQAIQQYADSLESNFSVLAKNKFRTRSR